MIGLLLQDGCLAPNTLQGFPLLRIRLPGHRDLLSSENMNSPRTKKVMSAALAATLCTGTLIAGDGTGEPGFVAPPREMKRPPAAPRMASSAETVISCCCCTAPMSRTEAKKAPQPPVLLIKLREDNSGSGKN